MKYSTDTDEQQALVAQIDALSADIARNERKARRADNMTELHRLAAVTQTMRIERRKLQVKYYEIEDAK